MVGSKLFLIIKTYVSSNQKLQIYGNTLLQFEIQISRVLPFLFKFIFFYLKEERERSRQLVNFPNVHNNHDWTRPMLGAQDLVGTAALEPSAASKMQ